MTLERVSMPAVKLVGLAVRTNNTDEMNSATAKISQTIKTFFSQQMMDRIAHRLPNSRLFSVYSQYANQHHGDYTYFFGIEVTDFAGQPDDLATLTVPMQTCAKLTVGPGPMPAIVTDAWGAIWGMTEEALGGRRAYRADYEIYDERSANPANAIVDIYVGLHA